MFTMRFRALRRIAAAVVAQRDGVVAVGPLGLDGVGAGRGADHFDDLDPIEFGVAIRTR